jgi:hypothetical protein
MSDSLDTPIGDPRPFRLGKGPSGSVVALCAEVFAAEALADGDAVPDDEAEVPVTVTVSAALGGVQVALVLMVAVAFSMTEVTDVAVDATGTCASRITGFAAATEAMVHDAAPFPLAQPLLNAGFWPVGLAVSVTVTSEAGPSFVATCTT